MKKNILILLLLFGSVLSVKTYAQEPFTIAQGDGDPEELMNFDLTEDDMAVVTPEGDFMVPTFLLPTIPPVTTYHENALASKQNEEPTEESSMANLTVVPETTEKPVETKTPELAPVVEKAKVPVETPKVKEEKKEASVVVEKEENKPAKKEVVMTPVEGPLPSDPEIKAEPVISQISVEPETASVELEEVPVDLSIPKSFVPEPGEEVAEKPEFNLKTRPKRRPEKTATPTPRTRHLITSSYADEVLKSFQEVGNRLTFKVPKELKVVFYKNATDISGQTMKWIKVFATQALRDSRLKVDIRVSTQTPEIQQARIGLIEQMLQEQGLTAHQIQISYSDRDADSLILSTKTNELWAQNIETRRRFGKMETKKIREW